MDARGVHLLRKHPEDPVRLTPKGEADRKLLVQGLSARMVVSEELWQGAGSEFAEPSHRPPRTRGGLLRERVGGGE